MTQCIIHGSGSNSHEDIFHDVSNMHEGTLLRESKINK